MSNDVFYGAESEVRFGRMADAATDPATWYRLPFVTLTLNGQREQRPRNLLNTARHNALDPTPTQAGLYRLSGDLVIPADTRQAARFLWLAFGNPVSAAVAGDEEPPLYTHRWQSGSKAANLFAAQVRIGPNKVRIYRGLTGAALSLDASGEQVKDYDLALSLRGQHEEDVSAFIGSAPSDMTPDAPVLRTVVKIDGEAFAPRCLSSRWSWDRAMREDIFMTPTPNINGHSPQTTVLQGQATFRAMGVAYDDLEAADESFDVAIAGIGAIDGHGIDLIHNAVKFSRPPVAFAGAPEVERTWNWDGAQTAASAAATVILTNDVASYA